MSNNIRISILSPTDMGKLARSFDAAGETLLATLVSDPTNAVAAYTYDDTWPAREPGIVAELAAAPDKDARDAIKKRIPAIVPARFAGGNRLTKECLGRQVIGRDFDAVVAETFEGACAFIRAQLPKRFLAVHTTATERNPGDAAGRPKGTWCLRAYEILDREATPAEWESRVKPYMSAISGGDDNARDVARLLFVPVRTAGYRFRVYEGPRTRLDDLAAVEAPAARVQSPPTAPPVGAHPAAAVGSSDLLSHDDRRAALLLAGFLPPPYGTPSRREIKWALAGASVHEKRSVEYAEAFRRETWSHLGPVGSPSNPNGGEGTGKENDERTTYRRHAEGKHITGWPRLAELLGCAGVVDDVQKLRNGTAAMSARGDVVRAQLTRDEAAGAVAGASASTDAVTAMAGALLSPVSVPLDEWGVIDWDAVDPPVKWVVEGIVQEATVTLAYGAQNSLKTWTMYEIAAAVASGRPWLGRPVTQGLVVLLDYESSPRQARRRMRVLRKQGLTNVRYVNPKEFLDEDALWVRLAELRPWLVIVDSLSRGMVGRDENDQKVAAKPLDSAKRLARYCGAAVIFIHHKVKSETAEGYVSARGSGAITAAAEGWLEFRDWERLGVSVERARIHCGRLKESVPFGDIILELSDAQGLVEVKETEPKTVGTEDRIRAALVEALRGRHEGIAERTLIDSVKGNRGAKNEILAKLKMDRVVIDLLGRGRKLVALSPGYEQ